MKSLIKKFKKKQKKEEKLANSLPTNETLEDHRRQILKAGRKHSRPLSDTQQKIVLISTLLVFFILISGCYFYLNAVYSNLNNSSLVHSVSKVIPTPVVGVNGSYAGYEDILFHVQTAQNVADHENKEVEETSAFNSAAEKVIEATLIKQIADEQSIVVTDEELEEGIAEPILLAGGEETFDSTIMEIYGWTREDFKREFRSQLLKSRIVTTELYEFNQQADFDNFSTLANNLGLISVEVSNINAEEVNEDVAAVAQEILNVGDVEGLLYGESAVFVVKKTGEESFEYVSQTYEEIEAFIEERKAQSEIITCLNQEVIIIENVTKKSTISCLTKVTRL